MKSHSCFASTTRLVAAREEPDTDFVTCGSGVKQTTPTINPKYTRWFIIQLQKECAALVHYTVCRLQRGLAHYTKCWVQRGHAAQVHYTICWVQRGYAARVHYTICWMQREQTTVVQYTICWIQKGHAAVALDIRGQAGTASNRACGR